MKLATYQDGSRDGQLVVVSRDLTQAHYATDIATRLQQLLDDWNFLSPQLEDLSTTLNQGKARHAFPFDPAMCMAPLPRAAARLLAPPEGPLRRVASDALMGAREAWFGAAAPLQAVPGLVAITGDIDTGADAGQALDGLRLLALGQDWQQDGESLSAGFSPVAVTPDELGEAWRGGRLSVPLLWRRNGQALGALDLGAALPQGLGERLAEAVRRRPLRAGSLLMLAAQPADLGGLAEAEGLAPGDGLSLVAAEPLGEEAFGRLDNAVGQLA
ncbi:fumarylacetoacetate hydrolase [Ideonella alba]|uniref:fumarylacetoacetate hydrolase n=1 Tax=Ideonella alba TaxID=2824118 RepID=UPI001FFD8834|nr:fumarylacetoacetate hydrolase [Ideonella alba]